jgi:hypothetical protein
MLCFLPHDSGPIWRAEPRNRERMMWDARSLFAKIQANQSLPQTPSSSYSKFQCTKRRKGKASKSSHASSTTYMLYLYEYARNDWNSVIGWSFWYQLVVFTGGSAGTVILDEHVVPYVKHGLWWALKNAQDGAASIVRFTSVPWYAYVSLCYSK